VLFLTAKNGLKFKPDDQMMASQPGFDFRSQKNPFLKQERATMSKKQSLTAQIIET
jgi:hypothetical protein